MKRNSTLANRLREVLLSGHWISHTNFKVLILSVEWEEAIQKVGNLNTIAALTFHINYYLEGLLYFFDRGKLEIQDKYSFNVPLIQCERDWRNLVDGFLDNAERFANLVEQLPDSQLDQTFVDEKYGSYLRNIEGVIEHSYYHLGQVSLLKKLISDAEKCK